MPSRTTRTRKPASQSGSAKRRGTESRPDKGSVKAKKTIAKKAPQAPARKQPAQNNATKRPAPSGPKRMSTSAAPDSSKSRKSPAGKPAKPAPAPLKRNTTLAEKVKGETSKLRPRSRTKTPAGTAAPKSRRPAKAAAAIPSKAAPEDGVVAARKSLTDKTVSAVTVRGGVNKRSQSKTQASGSRRKAPSLINRKPRKALHNVWQQTELRKAAPKFSVVQGDRRGRGVRWEPSEVDALRSGYERVGSSWSAILASSSAFHSSRTQVDLKDKWRSLCRAEERPQKAPLNPDLPPQTHFRARVEGAPRRHVKWTQQEMELLDKGVKKFGTKWTVMLTTLNGFHETRTSVDLKDKWRNLNKELQRKQAAAAQ